MENVCLFHYAYSNLNILNTKKKKKKKKKKKSYSNVLDSLLCENSYVSIQCIFINNFVFPPLVGWKKKKKHINI